MDAQEASTWQRRDVVLTGTGHSGTTLTCHLLNKLSDTVALSEPISPGKFADALPNLDAVAQGVEGFYSRMRRMALKKGVVKSKHLGGVVPDNPKGLVDGERRRIVEKGNIPVGKDLSPDFQLVIKQPGLFTALLPVLLARFPCYAIVRNPLPILASVDSITSRLPGVPATAKYDPELIRRYEIAKDPVDAHLRRLDFHFARYLDLLPPDHLLRYEDLVASGGRALAVINPRAEELDEPLESRNLNPLYAAERMSELGQRLLASEGAYWRVYKREDVEELLEQMV